MWCSLRLSQLAYSDLQRLTHYSQAQFAAQVYGGVVEQVYLSEGPGQYWQVPLLALGLSTNPVRSQLRHSRFKLDNRRLRLGR